MMATGNLQNKIPLSCLSLVVLLIVISVSGIQESDALKSKGTPLPDVGSKKVCGDKLCSESYDWEKPKHKKSEPAFKTTAENQKDNRITHLESRIAELESRLAEYEEAEAMVQRNLDLFDELDLVAFNSRDMERIAEIHMPDVRVINRDGQVTEPYDPHHKDELLFLFETFPDFTINEHPIAFGQGNWTAGLSISTGTFLNQMRLPDGTVIEPTGKSFEVGIVTLAKWHDGRIVEEYLMWDNEGWMRQIGVASQPTQILSSDLKTAQQLSSGEIRLSYSDGKPDVTNLGDINSVLHSVGVRVSTIPLPEEALPVLKISQTRSLYSAESNKLISIFSMDREDLLEQINKAGRTPASPQGGFLNTSEYGVPPYPKVYDMKAMTPETVVHLQEKFGKLHVNSADSGMGIDEVMTIVSGGPWTWFFVLPDGAVCKLTLGPVSLDGQAWRISYPGLVPHGGFLDAEYGLVVAYAHGPENFVMRYEDPSVNSPELLGTNPWVDYSGETPKLLD